MKLWSKFMFLRHRTMINPDFGVVRGIPKNLKAFPVGDVQKNLTYAEQMRESVDVTLRRDTLAYREFDEFVLDSKKVALVEESPDENGSPRFFCSCKQGYSGVECVHVLACQMEAGLIPTPSLLPIANSSSKGTSRKDASGRKGKARKQR